MPDYYSASSDPADNSDLDSSIIRAEWTAVAAGFAKVAGYTGNGSKILAINSGGTAMEALTTTGTGSGVRATSPTLVTPVLGVATATSINKLTLTQPATGATLTLTDGKTLAATNTLTLSGTDSTIMTFPSTSATIARTDAANTFTGVQAMTSPAITTNITTPSTSFDVFNTTATTVNAFGAASVALNIGNASAAAAFPGGISIPTAKTLDFVGTGGILGTATNDSTAAGNVGESVESTVGATAAPTSTQYGDLTSITLTAGDWIVSAQTSCAINTATITKAAFGIGTVTGNDSTGLTTGDTYADIGPPTATYTSSGSIAAKRYSLAGTTTLYLKMQATFSAGSPNFLGRISARRIR